MSSSGEWADEDGFTIQEILVVLIVSSLLVSFGLSLFQFTTKIVCSWSRKSEASGLVNRTIQQIALDVQKSSVVSAVTDSSLVLQNQIGSYVSFLKRETGVWRNDVLIGGVPQALFDMNADLDSEIVTIRTRPATSSSGGALRIRTPWSSRQEFTRSLARSNWNGTSN